MRTHHKCKIGGIVPRRGGNTDCMSIECTAHIAIKLHSHNAKSVSLRP